MEEEDNRQEYVMAEDGLIWRGSYNRLRPTVWKYSQFERDILDCALHLMIQVGKVRVSGRSDPVVISRILSAAVNISTRFHSVVSFFFILFPVITLINGSCCVTGKFTGRQRCVDGQLVRRFCGWYTTNQMAGFAKNPSTILQDEKTG